MKKVRYAIGVAAGVAPVLGLMTPVANAAVTYAPRTGAKTVSLHHSGIAPDTTTCTGSQSKSVSGTPSHNLFHVGVGVRGDCVVYAYGSIHLSGSPQPLHSLRTQVFSARGDRVFSGRVHSFYSSGRVYFSQSVGVKGRKVCETVVKAVHPYHTVGGPVCESV
ncbi:MAG TPA: hypothetical protein VGH27_23590 [Streptosporangiaceae bacterium]